MASALEGAPLAVPAPSESQVLPSLVPARELVQANTEGDSDRVRALDAEIQAVKQRAVKKIRGLEERLKATTMDLERERERALQLREAWAAQEHSLHADVARLEAKVTESSQLRGQVSALMQQELSLTQSLQVLQLTRQDDEEAHERELSRQACEVRELQEERQASQDALATFEAEVGELRAALAESRRESAAIRDEAQSEVEQWRKQDAAQRDKISKLKGLLAEARVLIKKGAAQTKDAMAKEPAAEPDRSATAAGTAAADAVAVLQLRILRAELMRLEAELPPLVAALAANATNGGHADAALPPAAPLPACGGVPPAVNTSAHSASALAAAPGTSVSSSGAAPGVVAEEALATAASDGARVQSLRRELEQVRRIVL